MYSFTLKLVLTNKVCRALLEAKLGNLPSLRWIKSLSGYDWLESKVGNFEARDRV